MIAPALASLLSGIPMHPEAPCWTQEWLGHSDFAVERRRAAKLCASCPILWECAEAAEARAERWGVWGGIDRETAYRLEHTSPNPEPRKPAACGTESGYKAHHRLHQPPCDPCRSAHALHVSEWREARKTAS